MIKNKTQEIMQDSSYKPEHQNKEYSNYQSTNLVPPEEFHKKFEN